MQFVEPIEERPNALVDDDGGFAINQNVRI
jgi:hypothetical protein